MAARSNGRTEKFVIGSGAGVGRDWEGGGEKLDLALLGDLLPAFCTRSLARHAGFNLPTLFWVQSRMARVVLAVALRFSPSTGHPFMACTWVVVVAAVAYHFCLNLLARFSQPRTSQKGVPVPSISSLREARVFDSLKKDCIADFVST